jgi:NAD(P)-dependent dehydrogenase (short-subunit alcohol dehydrogenase family)
MFDDRARAAGSSADDERAHFVRHIPLGALGHPDEVADTYVYLASPLSAYVTGQHLVVDGGWSVGSA